MEKIRADLRHDFDILDEIIPDITNGDEFLDVLRSLPALGKVNDLVNYLKDSGYEPLGYDQAGKIKNIIACEDERLVAGIWLGDQFSLGLVEGYFEVFGFKCGIVLFSKRSGSNNHRCDEIEDTNLFARWGYR
jgi:hypothetical protein